MAFAWPGLDRTSDQSGSASSPPALPPVADKKVRTRPRVLSDAFVNRSRCSWLTIGDMRASDVLCAQARCSVVIPPSREPSVKPWACSLSNSCSRLVVCQLRARLLRLVHACAAIAPVAVLCFSCTYWACPLACRFLFYIHNMQMLRLLWSKLSKKVIFHLCWHSLHHFSLLNTPPAV